MQKLIAALQVLFSEEWMTFLSMQVHERMALGRYLSLSLDVKNFFHSKHQSTYNGCVPSPNHIPTFSLQSIRFQPCAQPISKILLKINWIMCTGNVTSSIHVPAWQKESFDLFLCVYSPCTNIFNAAVPATYMGCIYYIDLSKAYFSVLSF